MLAEFRTDAEALSLAPGRLSVDAANARELFESGWRQLDQLPRRSQRNGADKAAGIHLVETLSALGSRLCRMHRREMYDTLTERRTRTLRIEELLFLAADRWPGLVPSRQELSVERERMQADKDGREILQGVFASHMLAEPTTGAHLIASMLAPTPEASSRLDELIAAGSVDLGAARVEVRGEAGFVYFHHPRFLNAEDDDTLGPLETAIDLVLLHPGVKMGVLRGDPVEHPKYRGRRIFSAGINLTKLYHGQVSYLFYLTRDLGLVHKLYRGLAMETPFPGEPETTLEKPWMAVVDAFAIGGGCQLLLVVDHVIAESGAYFNLPARKEGIIPGAANLRLPRFVGEGVARDAILFDRKFEVDDPVSRNIVSEVHAPETLDQAVERAVDNAVGSGMVSASGNRKAIRVQTEPVDVFRQYMATYAREQALCHLSEQLTDNLERHWNASSRTL